MTGSTRSQVLNELQKRLSARTVHPVLRVAIDGVDGAGKTTFADGLAAMLRQAGRRVIRASADDFHNPRAVRYRHGRDSPEGYYRDSYNLEALKRELLDPLSPGRALRYRSAVFDVSLDQPVSQMPMQAQPGDILLVDGLFLHRPELRERWHDSVFLRVPFEVSVPRGAARGPGYGSPDPGALSNRRYVEGHRLYFPEADPEAWAGVVIDQTSLERPIILAARDR